MQGDKVKYKATRLCRIVFLIGWMIVCLEGNCQIMDSASRLQAEVMSLDGRRALVQWNEIASGCQYHLFRKTPTQTGFQEICQVSSTSVEDSLPMTICSDTVLYRIHAFWSDTQFLSNDAGALFHDNEPTSTCALDVVSVENQHIILSWNPSPDRDIMGYLICKGSPCLDFDTVWGRQNCRYECMTLSVEEVHSFRIYAFDSCWTASALTDPYNNMVIDVYREECERTVHVSWNPYHSMPGGLLRYRLMVDSETGFHSVAEIMPEEELLADYDFPVAVNRVQMAIVAESPNGETAWSNVVEYELNSADTAQYLEIVRVSVSDAGNSVEIVGSVDASFQADGYTLYRSDGGPFLQIGHLPYTGASQLVWDNPIAQGQHLAYRIGVMDGCGEHEKYSPIVHPIMLELEEDEGVHLYWNDYDGWSNVAYYRVYRRNGSEGLWTPILSTTDTWADDELLDLSSRAYYRVAAFNGTGDSVLSTQVSLHREGRVWIPNAFTPGENSNSKFCVESSFIEEEDYSLHIYNRQGMLVFETDDPSVCWDGTYRGAALPSGAYIYLVYCGIGNGETRYFKGTVMLIR